MRLLSYRDGREERPACLVDGRVLDLRQVLGEQAPPTLLDLLREGLGGLRDALARGVPGDIPAVAAPRPLAPIPRPGKIIAVGRNYRAHAAETGSAALEQPRLLIKLPSTVIGPGAPIRRPDGVLKLDFEIEIAAIIGATLAGATEDQAAAGVAGYTILNDVTARELQLDCTPPQTSFSKSMDGFAPMGPWLVTPDEVGDPASLRLRTWVNGRLMQDGCAADMTFSIPRVIAYVSRYVRLEPGDVIATGTPEGVGAFRSPPIFLQPGDRLRMEVDKLGVLENEVA